MHGKPRVRRRYVQFDGKPTIALTGGGFLVWPSVGPQVSSSRGRRFTITTALTRQAVKLSNHNVVFQEDAALFVCDRYRVTEQGGLDHL